MSRLARTTTTRPLAAANSFSSVAGHPAASAIKASTSQVSRYRTLATSRRAKALAGPSRPAYNVALSTPLVKRTLATSTTVPDTTHHTDSDIVIVGGGVVGLGLACDLVASQAISASPAPGTTPITLIEASDLTRLRSWTSDRAKHLAHSQASSSSSSSSSSTSYDGLDWENRVISLTSENLNWLKRIGVYPYLVEHRLRPVNSMRVWDGLSGALLDFDSSDLSTTANSSSQISVMVEISNLQQAMLHFLEQGPGKHICTIKDNAKVDSILPGSKVEAESTSIEQDPWPIVQLSTGDAVQARLLVGADGPNSPVRRYAGIGDYGWPYDRRGLVGTLRCRGVESGEPAVGHTAYQRFLPSGTIAFLPLSESTASMVWTLQPEVAAAMTLLHRETAGLLADEPLAKLVDAAFRLPWAYIERLFERVVAYTNHPLPEGVSRNWSWLNAEIPTEAEWIERNLGEPLPESGTGEVPPKILSLDAKSVASFPLNLKHADAYLGASLNGSSLLPSGLLAGAMAAVGLAPGGAGQGAGRGRTVLVGDAAHTIHPLAGQGLNLGIADVRSLSNTLRAALGAGADVGSYNALKGYARERYWENQKMLSAVDHLHWLYAGTPVPLSQQADGGMAQRERDGMVKSAAKEVVGRGVVWARSTGLEVINELGLVKNAFMRQAGSTTTTSSNMPWPTTRRSLSTSVRSCSLNTFSRPRHFALSNFTTSQVRLHSSHSTGPLASDAYTTTTSSASPTSSSAATTSTPTLTSLTPSQRRALQDMLRVDHSGEIAANTIYQGQADMFGALGDVKNRDLSIEMWATEKKHLQVMRALLRQHNVRPSLLLPVWSVAGRVLGGVTALLGPRSAMACTEAVESVIGEHYDDQLKELKSILEKESEEGGVREEVHPSLPLLSDIIKEFRDDELEHLDTAVENESQQAAGHALLSAVIAAGCRGAIWVASRV
ncbi:related to Ubiquinone biosynthesis protein COQ6 and COQ7 [Ustilago trichophora]|uniref:5-demethoxyubiquinone hydroxylase, mitochondrial n=1 Tax=Ustilago trichophora TaxID=86804 RepID=A0A5C3EQS5_9BASI|nr:related to Ubiquinone biosynthesis protein COQ6 and COQ7 [Ustilago trichophora]